MQETKVEGSQTFWNLVEKQGGEIHLRQDEERVRRTWYLDTPGLDFRRRQFVLRVREEEDEGKKEFKVTLKYRAPDRYISASQDLSSTKKGKHKFEEDILPPFTSKFSQSMAVKRKKEPNLGHVDQVVRDGRLFGGRRLGRADVHTAINGHRIERDDLGVQLPGQFEPQACFARRGWAG